MAKFQKNSIPWNKGLTKEQMPASMYSEERNQKVGTPGNQFAKGNAPWNKKRKIDSMVEQLCACGCGGIIAVNYNFRKRVQIYIYGHQCRGRKHTTKTKKLMSKTALTINKATYGHLGRKHTEQSKKLISKANQGTKHSEESKRNQSEFMKCLWQSKEYAQKVFGRREKSAPEIIFEALLLEHDFPYYFVGNGQFQIGRKNPDFLHKQRRKIIEIYGDFFHKGQDPQDRINYFKQYGYDCLVFWASELKDSTNVIKKIQIFDEEK